jgi:hypothetical protein
MNRLFEDAMAEDEEFERIEKTQLTKRREP